MRNRLGEQLIDAAELRDEQLGEALIEQARTGEWLGAVLVRLGFVTERQIVVALADQLGFAFVDACDAAIDLAALSRIPKDVALRWRAAPISVTGDVLTVAMAEPLQFSVVRDLEALTGCRIRQVMATADAITRTIERWYPDPAPSSRPADPLLKDRESSVGDRRRGVIESDLDPPAACVTCGGSLAEDFVTCPQCGTPIGVACRECGRALRAGWHFCPYCSAAVDQWRHR